MFIVFLFTSFIASSQTYPDNVDSIACSILPSATIFGIQKNYQSTENTQMLASVLVGDLDGDNYSEIVSLGNYGSFNASALARDIKILDYQLNLIRSISTPVIFSYQTLPFALAKVDITSNQGQIIIAVPYNTTNVITDRNVLKCYNYDGSLLWTSDPYYNQSSNDWEQFCPAPGFADFNGDGVPEVYVFNRIFNAQTGKLLAQGGDTESMGKNAVYDKGSSSHTVAIDIDGDGLAELVAGDVVYKISITNTSGLLGNSIEISSQADLSTLGVGDGYSSVGDIDLDGDIDIVVVRRYSATQNCLYVWDGQTNSIIGTPLFINRQIIRRGPSQPFVGDIDNDNYPEICFTTDLRLHAYKYDNISGDIVSKWSTAMITSDQSGATALTLFDFNQDGNAELVYRDQSNLRIIDGSGLSPVTIQTIPCASQTGVEYPVIADVNNDGAAEIIVSGNVSSALAPSFLYVYGAATGSWAPARPVWNQYQYNVINVNKDLTIPKYQFNTSTLFANGKRPFNAFLQQATTIDQNGNPYQRVVADTTRIDTTIIKGQSYAFGTKVYTTAVKDTLQLTNAAACDSLVFLNLQVVDAPDNIKQIDCFNTNVDAFPWGIRLAESSPVYSHEYYQNLVGDLNNDGIPEILSVKTIHKSADRADFVIFEGNDLSKYATIQLGDYAGYYTTGWSMLRVADYDIGGNDTIGLMLFHTSKGLSSYKFSDIYNVTKFKTLTRNIDWGTIALADFNNDGRPEAFIGNDVFDAYSLDFIGAGSANEGMGYFHGNQSRVSCAADVLPDVPGTELICGSTIYSVDVLGKVINVEKTITPPAGFSSDGHTEVADFDGDGLLDVLVKQNSTSFGIYAYNPRTGTILFSQANIATSTTRYQNYPLIGDIDADGKVEIVMLYASSSQTNPFMKAYKYDGSTISLMWTESIQDVSGSTGMTLFDFNQDGIKEIVYRDGTSMRIINASQKSHLTGADTTVYNLAAFPLYSGTVIEYPIVADCDADGEAEIIISGRLQGDPTSRLHIFKSLPNFPWPYARKVWNQYAYNVTNVNNDLTVPAKVFNNATIFPNAKQPFNNFLEQATTLNQNGDMVFELLPDSSFIRDTICSGDAYFFKGDTLSVSGRYIDTLRCDSFLILDFVVKNIQDTLIVRDICEGDSFNFNGEILVFSGLYKDTLISSINCDSIVTLNLIVNSIITTILRDSFCVGGSYFYRGNYLSAPGEYLDTLSSVSSCDSIIKLTLTNILPVETVVNKTICEGESYYFEGDAYNVAGSYLKTLNTIDGCDSILKLNLYIHQPEIINISYTIKEGEEYPFGGEKLSVEGVYSDTLKNVYNCDSILLLDLSLIKSLVVPDIFSPNNDGVNDRLLIKNIDKYPNNSIKIFNRWGNKVWEAGPYLNNWDGTNQFGVTVGGNELPVGTYFYILELGDGSDAYKGYVYLNR